MRIVPSAGGTPREILRLPRGGGIYSTTWTRDGRHLLFTRKGELWRIAVDGGSPEKLGLTMDSLREVRIHPDGRRIAFAAGSNKGELWAMENLLPPL